MDYCNSKYSKNRNGLLEPPLSFATMKTGFLDESFCGECGSFHLDFLCKAIKRRHSTIYTEDKSDASLVEGRDYYWWTAAASPQTHEQMRSPFGCGKLFESYTHTHSLVHTESGAGSKRIKGGKEKEKSFSAENLKEDRKKVAI